MGNGLHCDACGETKGARPLWLWEGGALLARTLKLGLKTNLCASCWKQKTEEAERLDKLERLK